MFAIWAEIWASFVNFTVFTISFTFVSWLDWNFHTYNFKLVIYEPLTCFAIWHSLVKRYFLPVVLIVALPLVKIVVIAIKDRYETFLDTCLAETAPKWSFRTTTDSNFPPNFSQNWLSVTSLHNHFFLFLYFCLIIFFWVDLWNTHMWSALDLTNLPFCMIWDS